MLAQRQSEDCRARASAQTPEAEEFEV
jgi:hypothetical protein